MANHDRRWVPLTLALVMLPLCLVACQAPDSVGAPKKAGIIVISTAVKGSPSAVPTFLPLTIGVWTAAATPDAHAGAKDNDNTHISVNIYILCMLQDATEGGVLGPAGNEQIHVSLTGPVTQSFTGTTDANGLAQVHVSFTDTRPNTPVTVNVTTTWHGATYHGQTYLILGDAGTPSPSPSPSANPSPATAPTNAPEPTSVPESTPTDQPQPTATSTTDPTATPGP